ncbi:ABC transporter ATP-binding protein [Erysipelothrix rhusiopathiae]|uniref:ABC transporter ATP-binding protein n=1 Tax=Erysipelothrix rhusiopathiae TaxID=1648 RepID=UPI000DF96668|nr:ABC transporter ATP-binding protein [Erysipelothrix rhusiopathiae]STC97556.1 Putative multidrug export ATP-binding/permease protein SAV1866 [Erysipelothrix rhusiopathiae]
MNQNNASVKPSKPENSKAVLKKMIALIKPFKVKMIIVIIFALLSTIFTIVGPKVMGQATTVLFEGLMAKVQGVGSVDFEKIKGIVLWLLGIYLASLLFSYIQGWIMARISRDLTYDLRKRMHEKIEKLPLKYFDGTTTGEVLSLVTNDIDVIDQNLTSSITQVITSITTIVGILYMMFSINWQMTLAALLVLPLSFGLIFFIMSKSQVFFRNQQKYLGSLNGHIEEMYGSHVVVKAYNGEERSIAEFDDHNNNLYDAAWKSSFFSGMIHPIMNFVGNFGYVVVSILGGYFASGGIISVGDIQSFIQYMRSFMNPIAQLGNLSSTFQQSLAAAERVFNYLEEPEEVEDADTVIDVSKVEGHVSFENVNFGYDSDVTIINDFSADVKPGQKIAIVGPTGAGKTTIVKLLMRFYDVTSGSIKVDDHDIRDIKREDLRNLIGMVLQDTWLYSDTINENIRYGKLDATDEEVHEAAMKAQVDYFVRTLPEGYQTVLNEETTNISQGQKQLLTIARAILADPKILILDEATSSVDTRTEVLIQKALDVLMEGRTSFIIAHRLSTIKNADLILVMDKGDIVEKGSHDELLAQNGFYATLYNSQFSEED